MSGASAGRRGTTAAGPLERSLEAACTRWAERPAITAPSGTVTYAALGDRVARLAGAYRDLGIRPGDRVLCQLPNSIEHVVAVNAAWAVGAVHVGTDNDLTGRELAWIASNTEAAALIHEARESGASSLVRAVRDASPATRIVTVDGMAAMTAEARPLSSWAPPHGRDDTAHLLLTSGTTGAPKAVMETIPAFWAKMQFFADALVPTVEDVHLAFLPMAHVFGLRLAMMALLSGGRLVLAERFSPTGALETIARERVTILPGMPAHFTLLFDALDRIEASGRDRIDTASLRWAISAASAIPRALVERIYARLGVELLYVYGCSENFTVITTDPDDILGGSVGRDVFRGPVGTPPNGAIAAFEPGPGGARLQPGEVGELAFGADRPVPYWKAPPAATDGWYRTGDLGRVDRDGRVYVMGRLKELVNRGGLHVSPTEVETAIRAHPAVADSAVVGTPDPVVGEAICACIVPAGDNPPDLAGLRAFLRPVLARHKLPDELCFVPSIPRTKIGKVDRPALVADVVGGGRPRERARRE